MNNYSYHKCLKTIWEDAVASYKAGNRDPKSYFDNHTLTKLNSIGLTEMVVYDYAEDFVTRHEPDFETFLLVCDVRRDYFLNIQNSKPSNQLLDSSTLPPKSDEISGIVWLPRIIPKAIAMLRGELPPETMYGCGGDRQFFKDNRIHPAEFLRVAWAYENEVEKLVDWVVARKSSKLTSQ
jgi:hypothetical protein